MVHSPGQLMMKATTKDILTNLIVEYPILQAVEDKLEEALKLLIVTFQSGRKLLCCGNGGSAADCEHIVGELMKGFKMSRSLSKELASCINDKALTEALQYGLPTISLVSQMGLMTAFGNDRLPAAVFAQQVLGYGKAGDTLLCISTSGNSLNCVYAAKTARALGVRVISLTGQKDSKLKELSDVIIQAPALETYKVQELHLPIYHALCLALENEFYGD